MKIIFQNWRDSLEIPNYFCSSKLDADNWTLGRVHASRRVGRYLPRRVSRSGESLLGESLSIRLTNWSPMFITSSYLVTPLMGADLNNIIKTQKLSDEHVQFLVYQILRGLKYIHSAGIIHRVNIKILTRNTNFGQQILICDNKF